jgi:hypothetical protein
MFGFISKMLGGSVVNAAEGVANIIDKFVETDEEKKAAEIILMKTQQEPDKWQALTNQIEATHRSMFVAGWRPFIGWICGIGIGCHFVFFPIIHWGAALAGRTLDMPELAFGELMTLVISLLGLGATRTYEKKNNLTK